MSKKRKPGATGRPTRPSNCGHGWGGTKIPQHPGAQHFCNQDAGHYGKHKCGLCGEEA